MSDDESDPRDLPGWEVTRETTISVTVYVHAEDETAAEDAADGYLNGHTVGDLADERGARIEDGGYSVSPASGAPLGATVLDPDGNMILR